MHELCPDLMAYFAEIKSQRRLELLDSIHVQEKLDEYDSKFLRVLYHERYSGGDKDIWLWRALCLQMLYNRGNPLIFKKSRPREINAILDELHMNDDTPSHENLLYWEYRNVARLYLSTCRASGYASSFMGFRQASDDEKILRACQDIWQMSEGIARRDNLQDKMQLWCGAFRDELVDYDPVCKAEYQRLNNSWN